VTIIKMCERISVKMYLTIIKITLMVFKFYFFMQNTFIFLDLYMLT